MSNSSLDHKQENIQLHEIHTMIRSWDSGQNNIRSLTFCTRVKFSSWSWFDSNKKELKLIRSLRWLRKKYSFAYLGIQEVCESIGQRSLPICDLLRAWGLWLLTFDSYLIIIGTSKLYETTNFLKLHNTLINLSHFFFEIGPTWKFDLCIKCQWPFIVWTCISIPKHCMNFIQLIFFFFFLFFFLLLMT